MSAPPVAADKRDERIAPAFENRDVYVARFVYTYVPPDAKQNEWNILGVVDNHSNDPGGSGCGGYFQGRAHGNSPTWGVCTEVVDFSFGAKNASLIAGEFGCWTCGPSNGNRLGAHSVVGDASLIHRGIAYDGICEAEHGFLASNNGAPNAFWRHGITLRHWNHIGVNIEGSGGEFGLRFKGTMTTALDFTEVKSQSTIRLRDGQWISLDATDSVLIGYQLGRVKITMCGKSMFEVDINTGDRYVRGREIQL